MLWRCNKINWCVELHSRSLRGTVAVLSFQTCCLTGDTCINLLPLYLTLLLFVQRRQQTLFMTVIPGQPQWVDTSKNLPKKSVTHWHLPFNRVPTYLERQEESGNWGGQGRVWELCWWSWKNSMVADCATVAVILCQARSIMSYITYKLLTLHNWNCKQLCKVKVSTLLIVPTEWISSTLA